MGVLVRNGDLGYRATRIRSGLLVLVRGIEVRDELEGSVEGLTGCSTTLPATLFFIRAYKYIFMPVFVFLFCEALAHIQAELLSVSCDPFGLVDTAMLQFARSAVTFVIVATFVGGIRRKLGCIYATYVKYLVFNYFPGLVFQQSYGSPFICGSRITSTEDVLCISCRVAFLFFCGRVLLLWLKLNKGFHVRCETDAERQEIAGYCRAESGGGVVEKALDAVDRNTQRFLTVMHWHHRQTKCIITMIFAVCSRVLAASILSELRL